MDPRLIVNSAWQNSLVSQGHALASSMTAKTLIPSSLLDVLAAVTRHTKLATSGTKRLRVRLKDFVCAWTLSLLHLQLWSKPKRQNPGRNQNGCVLIAKATGNLRAETAVVMTRAATRARICFKHCSKMEASCIRPLAEVRNWDLGLLDYQYPSD